MAHGLQTKNITLIAIDGGSPLSCYQETVSDGEECIKTDSRIVLDEQG